MTELAQMEFHPRPVAGEPRPWAFPAPERGGLGNGLTVLRCHRPGQQVVAVEVLLDAPLDAEPTGLDGVATIMARAFSEGTDKHTAEEFAAELERCGATLEAHADHPGVRISLEVPASRLAKALGLVADALRAPAFADSEVERLVRNRLDEIPHELASPARRAAKELSRQLFPATSRMSRPRQGTEETVAGIDAAAVRAFYERHVRPATATAVVVGDLTGIDLDALLGDTLGSWTGSPAEPRPVPPVTADDTGRVVVVDRPGAVQTQLLIGRIGPDRHDRVWPAQVLGTYCLGGTLTSRLDRVLREEKGYTYGVRAFGQVLRSAQDGTGAAMLAISGSVDTPNTGPALRDLWTVLRTLAAEGLTDAERDVAVQNLVGVAPLKYETAAAVASTLADQVEQHLPDDYQAALYRQLATTGTVEATAAAVGAFPVDRLVTVLVGDAAQIKEPVEALGIGEVTVVAAE
ncbi:MULTISPECIES: pitrilysin family protein [unclassified Streptomyces]|uniref:M16 family metallopeptidase n=1 Tax=unclassified Streptomyces TaxID=2593676 RepID=UPI001F04AAE5|nr:MULTISPECIES: pitrilysin family protein [unclassified Streptomyces]MCH0561855.1 insulinase family protein [Streptomyces sp. MUM 2J]MCH0568832.1 insulinase family protein [Streptomyces sp. MUM 136J]